MKIGIDIGALYLKAVKVDANNKGVKTYYKHHKGNPQQFMSELLEEMVVTKNDVIGLTGVNAEKFTSYIQGEPLDTTFCQIQAVHTLYPEAQFIIDIGGVSSTLIQLGEEGKFQGYATNSLCAAGTGSFLDEQAQRLGVSYEDTKTFEHVDNPPTIATRCSVFAKSDLIHRQQEGCSEQEMWSGLCRGMTRTLFGTLLHGRPLSGKTAVIGGVALNKEVIRWIKSVYKDLVLVPSMPQFMAAFGAALKANIPAQKIVVNTFDEMTGQDKEFARFPWPLSLEKSDYPSFDTQENYVDDDDSEVRITVWPEENEIKGYVGIDVGSTSTKLVFMDENNNVILDVYRKTLGNPIGATKLLFKSLRVLAENKKVTFNVLGTGTTGSGRKIVGKLIGADAIINEISAHVAGAVKTDPTIDTIFEIGGQDSKYMHLVDGHIRDANMNYVCAAGTGSFVEEQANKLGYKIAEAGPKVLNVKPPRATDRCTVFMEQDMAKLIQNGASPEEAFAAVMVSVTKNYLNKVVGNRYYSRDKIFFQGATARNPALVAAFERLLDVKIVVSPYCHVMGSYGVALLTKELMETKKTETTFLGLDLERKSINLRKEKCELCQNDCAITYADIEGVSKSPSWGYMCGRDPEDEKVKVTTHYKLFRKRERLWREAGQGVTVAENARVIGLPQALATYTYYPLWQRFFNELGFQVQLSGPTTDEIRDLGTAMSGADFCFPAKVFIGHMAHLSAEEGVDYIFAPQMTHAGDNDNTTSSVFCPYVQGGAAYSKTAFKLNAINTNQILTPIVDMRLDPMSVAKRISKVISKPLGKSTFEIQKAWVAALKVQQDFIEACYVEGDKVLSQAKENNEKLLVLVGRPYNNFDKGLNLGIPQKLSEKGRLVIPMDFIRPDLTRLKAKYRNTYWNYGQKILAVLEEVRHNELLDAVYLTNFSCGPDSFILSYAEEIMGNRPFLALELDEHGADAGYMTRIEAFFDVLEKPRSELVERREYTEPKDDFRDRILWIPNMHPYGTDLMAAALRASGYDARCLPQSTEDTFELGRSKTRGSECLPTSLTIGRLLKTLQTNDEKDKKHAFFMPTAQGPCRFGQYATLHRQILDKEGFEDVSILSPTSFNGYQGLDEPIRRTIWKAMVAADVIQKSVCKVRPYESHKGEVDRVVAEHVNTLAKIIELNGDIVEGVKKAVKAIFSIPHKKEKRPLVGVVGEIYVRNNTYANEDVTRSIEDMGGEAWMTPIAEWLLFTNCPRNIAEHHAHKISMNTLRSYVKWQWLYYWEKKIYGAASPYLDDRHEPHVNQILDAGSELFPSNIGGEGILTLGRTIKFAEQKAAMVVNVAPFCCMPGTVTTAVFRQISHEVNMPIVNLFYDGTGGQNQRLKVYLTNSLEDTKTLSDKEEALINGLGAMKEGIENAKKKGRAA
jgi:predicted CoA-substrate-specific enzyme activase